jgi:hypothetical protein
MAFYIAPFTFDFNTSFIDVDSGYVDVDCSGLYTACKLAQASTEGIVYARIASGSGLNTLGVGVQVGLTVELLGSWQLRFPSGNYVARVAGGNLVGGPGGDPIAYTAGVQTLLIQSAASTVVTTGGGGSDPWATAIPGSYNPGSAGHLLNQLALKDPNIALQLSEVWKRLGLDSANPLVNTDALISAGPTLQLNVVSNSSGTTLTRQ